MKNTKNTPSSRDDNNSAPFAFREKVFRAALLKQRKLDVIFFVSHVGLVCRLFSALCGVVVKVSASLSLTLLDGIPLERSFVSLLAYRFTRARYIERGIIFSLRAFFPAQNLKSALLNVYASRETETEKERESTRVKEKRKYCFAVVVYVVISLSLSLSLSLTRKQSALSRGSKRKCKLTRVRV